MLAVTLFLGVVRAWIGRFSLNPDGVSYLDLSDAFVQHDWHGFVNAYWSPFYPVLLGIGRLALPTSKRWELPGVHIINLVIFAGAFACFEFFYVTLRNSVVGRKSASTENVVALIGESPFFILAHALFLWISLDLITVWDVTPDLLVSAFVYAIAGLVLRFRDHPSWKLAATLGAVLGFSYWAKAAMFPLAFVFMACGLLSSNRRLMAVKSGIVMAIAFLAVAGPWVTALSLQKHRLTFGDTGRLAYATLVNPGGVARNWQGDPDLGIKPVHPTREIASDPAIYEFAEPVRGTYPPWYDPSYWQEGRAARFALKPQLEVIVRHLFTCAELMLHQQNTLFATALTFMLVMGITGWRQAIGSHWPLFMMSGAAFGMYMLVHAQPRYLGAYVGLVWLGWLGAIRVPNHLLQMSRYLMCAAAVVLLIGVIDNTARAQREHGPYSVMPEIVLSEHLDAMGLHPGDPVGTIGGVGIFAARLSHAKVVVEIMDAPAFWRLAPERREIALAKFAQTGARIVVAPDPSPCPPPDPSWSKIEGEPYYVHRF